MLLFGCRPMQCSHSSCAIPCTTAMYCWRMIHDDDFVSADTKIQFYYCILLVSLLGLVKFKYLLQFLPRCMECRRGLAMRILSARLSVRLSVCPSVCLSVKRVCELWLNGRKISEDFYRAAWNADAVLRWDFCPSVCPSVKRVHCDKTEESNV